MKPLLTLLFALSTAAASFAQTVTTKVKGTVLGNQSPVEAATVSLLKAKDSSLVKVGVTDKSGMFEIEKSAEGKFLISISAVGYAIFYS